MSVKVSNNDSHNSSGGLKSIGFRGVAIKAALAIGVFRHHEGHSPSWSRALVNADDDTAQTDFTGPLWCSF